MPVDDLPTILGRETVRQIPNEKMDLHFPDFSLVISWLKLLGLDYATVFEQDDPEKILGAGNQVQQDVVGLTLEKVKSGDGETLKLLEEITRYLGEEDEPQKSEIILVFGSGDLGRVEKGAELFKAGLASRMIISGGQPYFTEEKMPEAVTLARHAISLGVPRESILIEPNSVTIPDNVKTSLNMMDNFGIDYGSIITVIAWFAQRRAWSYLMKFSPKATKVYRVNTIIDSGRLSKSEWYKNEFGLKVIFNEFVKLWVSVRLNTA